MESNAKTKVCKVCGRELPIEQFRANHKSKDGHLDTCFDCLGEKIKAGQIRGISKSIPIEKGGLLNYTDIELKEELLSRGWEVICTKTIRL